MGTQQIDSNWWQGQIGSHHGIFPITHVMELELPPTLKERSRSVHSTEPLFALALCDSVAQLDEELGFKTGDVITVTEILDSDWYYGELGSRKGMFLSSCVELIQDTSESATPSRPQPTPSSTIQKAFSRDQSYYGSFSDQQPTQATDHSHDISSNQSHLQVPDQSATYTSENTKSLDSSVSPYAMTLYQFEGQSDNELSFNANEIVYLIQHIDEQWTEGEIDGRIGLFPTSFVSIIVDCPYAFSESKAANQTEVSTTEEERKREIQQEQSEEKEDKQDLVINKQDLTINKQDLAIDKQDLDINENKNMSATTESVDEYGVVEGGVNSADKQARFALVLYSFTAETDQDLSVTEGDTLHIIERVNADWVRALEENSGKSGLVPSAFLDIIDDSPAQFSTDRNHEHKPGVHEIRKDEVEPVKQEMLSAHDTKVKSDIKESRESVSVQPTVSVSAPKPNKMENKATHDTSQQNLHRNDSKERGPTQSFNFTLQQKPVLPMKPQLSPKPVMKPKPNLSPKPQFPDKVRLQPVKETGDHDELLLKSSSSHVLSRHDELNNTLQKSLSNSELSSTSSASNTENRRATFSFGDVDTSKSLNDIISGELSKAKNHDKPDDNTLKMDNRSLQPARPALTRQHATSQHFSSSSNVIQANDPKRHSVNFPIQNSAEQRSTATDDFRGKFSTGNSVFFLDPVPSNKHYQPMRKPPPIPQRSFEVSSDFDRKPSLRKDPPPRPMGPRLASAPPTLPLIPVKVTESKHGKQDGKVQTRKPSRPAPTRPVPSRPAPTHPVPSRPAPSRPQVPSTTPLVAVDRHIAPDDTVKGTDFYNKIRIYM